MRVEALVNYIPGIVLKHLLAMKEDTISPLPQRYIMTTVAVWADISGFTKLGEKMASRGPAGAQYLAEHLNVSFIFGA
jgi:hypothetical protein